MTPISRPTTSPVRSPGFTLIEMLVVLTIIGLIAAVAVTMLPRGGGSPPRSRQAAKLASMIGEARLRAASTGRPVSVDLLDVSATTSLPLIFYPDGSNSGGTISVAGRPGWTVDSLTGALHENR